jgi:hypothetical protein
MFSIVVFSVSSHGFVNNFAKRPSIPFTDPVHRTSHLGLPAAWTVIAAWLTATPPSAPSAPPPAPALSKKCPEVPILPPYSTPPNPSFWSHFPSAPIPQQLFTPVDVFRFHNIYAQLRPTWTRHQQIVGDSALQSLLQGPFRFFDNPYHLFLFRTHPQHYAMANG